MNTASETRISNLLKLKEQYPTADAFCKEINISPTQFTQLKMYLNPNRGKSARGMGENLARKIEATLGLERGWMDVTHGEDPPTVYRQPAALPLSKHTSTLQAATLDIAQRLMEERLLSDMDCLKLLQSWEPLVKQLPER